MSRTGRSSTGLEVLHSSHQCRCELERRFRMPQLSQTKTSFLTRKKCYVGQGTLPSVVLRPPRALQVNRTPKNVTVDAKKGLPWSFQFLQSALTRGFYYEHDECGETLVGGLSFPLGRSSLCSCRESEQPLPTPGQRKQHVLAKRFHPVSRASGLYAKSPP